jgi:hypothetical protein
VLVVDLLFHWAYFFGPENKAARTRILHSFFRFRAVKMGDCARPEADEAQLEQLPFLILGYVSCKHNEA